jgi:Copper transport outer membrane protein, MctB
VFDLRYHVASLAAVFLMLVVGILIGVGISGRGFVDDAERRQFNDRIEGLQERVDAAEATVSDFERRQQAAEDFVESAYPVLVGERLAGKRVAVAVLGSVDQDSFPFVESAISDAGGRLARMRALELPLRLEAVEAALADRPELGGYVGDEELGNLGRDLGRELVTGGETPLWDALAGEIVEEQSGGLSEPVDGVVVIRTADPQAAGSSRFLAGVYQGLDSTGVPAVGVEPSRVGQSAIPVFQRYGLSTVDGIDSEPGQLALVLLLGDADPGDYGIRDTATSGILPPIEPLPAPGG